MISHIKYSIDRHRLTCRLLLFYYLNAVVFATTAKLRKGSEEISKQKIITDYKRFVESRREEGIFDLFQDLERHHIRLMLVDEGTPCKMYFYCRPDTALKKLVELFKEERLDTIVQSHVNTVTRSKTLSLQFDCNPADYEICKGFYSRPVGKCMKVIK